MRFIHNLQKSSHMWICPKEFKPWDLEKWLYFHVYFTIFTIARIRKQPKKFMFTDRCRKHKISILQWRKSDTITQLYKNKNFMILFILGIQSQNKTSIQRKGGFHRKAGVEVREYFAWIERKRTLNMELSCYTQTLMLTVDKTIWYI